MTHREQSFHLTAESNIEGGELMSRLSLWANSFVFQDIGFRTQFFRLHRTLQARLLRVIYRLLSDVAEKYESQEYDPRCQAEYRVAASLWHTLEESGILEREE